MDPRLIAFVGHKVGPRPRSFSAFPPLPSSVQAFPDITLRHAVLSWIHSFATLVVVPSIPAIIGVFVFLPKREASRD
jgi:hypothetical protein